MSTYNIVGNSRVAIVGSGLTAISAAKVLIRRGIKPVILDVGETLEKERIDTASRLSTLEPSDWGEKEQAFITSNPTVHNKDTLPLKLAFGSNYFYGNSRAEAPIEMLGLMPPFSYAKGGFSVGWGASVLPPDDCDLNGWPINSHHLEKYYKQVLSELPYSAVDDDLSNSFPVYGDKTSALQLTRGNKEILASLNKASRHFAKERTVFGQSRLLIQAKNSAEIPGCKYCGYCMSGCVYGCIYKSSQDIETLIKRGDIDYIPGVLVHSLKESGNSVELLLHTLNGTRKLMKFDRVFLAAGAVGSTRIVLQSKKLYKEEVRLLSTVGFIAPMLRMKRTPLDWPRANTEPGIFLEFKVDGLSDHWVHTQLSTPNELVLEKLGVDPGYQGLTQAIKKRACEHLVIAHCNMHSNHANHYLLSLENINGQPDKLSVRVDTSSNSQQAIRKAIWKLFSISRKFGCYAMIPFIQNSIESGSFHVGGSLPMKSKPKKETDTNLLGSPKGWQRIHVIDSSVFPSLPGTTIGLAAMANATRIATEIEL